VVGALPSSLLPLAAPDRLHVLVDRERELNLHLLVFALAAQPPAQDPHRSLSWTAAFAAFSLSAPLTIGRSGNFARNSKFYFVMKKTFHAQKFVPRNEILLGILWKKLVEL
jgi:hypothetical protein